MILKLSLFDKGGRTFRGNGLCVLNGPNATLAEREGADSVAEIRARHVR
jgi:hypothetical protein